ncbi:MAG: glycosyltransferase family 9 protein, partial [Candidatus Puniceispirillaceae bacterium]
MDRPRILVIKHGALGDLVQGFDAFAGLRAGRQDAHITLLTSPAFVELARRMPWFDEAVEDPRAP